MDSVTTLKPRVSPLPSGLSPPHVFLTPTSLQSFASFSSPRPSLLVYCRAFKPSHRYCRTSLCTSRQRTYTGRGYASMTRQQEHIALRIRATQDSSPPESWSHSNICAPCESCNSIKALSSPQPIRSPSSQECAASPLGDWLTCSRPFVPPASLMAYPTLQHVRRQGRWSGMLS